MRTKTIPEGIKSTLACGQSITIEYQPGNGSRYRLILIDNTKTEDGCYVVALMTEGNGTCMTVMPGAGYLSAGYVREKLKVGLGDSVVLAEIIAHLTGRRAADASLESSYTTP